MPVEVHCPNPACAKVHLVKNKYAGMRGKCPACGSWMLVPKAAPAGAVPAAAHVGRAENAEVAKEGPRHAPRAADRQDIEDAELVVVEEVPEEVVEAEEIVPARAPRHFSWLAVILLLLGLLSILGVMAMPHLERPAASATGDFASAFLVTKNKPRPPKPDAPLFLGFVGGTIAFFALVGLMASLFGKRFGVVSRAAGYLVTLTSLAVLLVIGAKLARDLEGKRQINQFVQEKKAQGATGEVTVSLGLGLWEGAATAAAAFLFFTLAATLMHRRSRSRLIFLIAVLAVAGVGGALVYLGVLNEALDPAIGFIWT